MHVCVFCGSSFGRDERYTAAASALAKQLAAHGCTLVYGGAKVGLMGVLADEHMRGGGKVIGVIPDFLVKKEVGHTGITQLEIVHSMHDRKRRMAELADAFVAIPGGWGTLDELAEIVSWKQLGLIEQPVAIYNLNGFFNPLLQQMEKMVNEGFLERKYFDQLIVSENISDLLPSIGVKHQ